MDSESEELREEGRDTCLFSAKVDCVSVVASVLKAVAISEKVNLFINQNGLKFTVEEGKYVQASVIVQKELFQDFILMDDDIFFKIPLKELLECLKIFCSDTKSNVTDTTMDFANTSLKFVYRRPGAPFELLLEENGMVTDFQLKTEDIDDLMQFELDIDPVCKVVMKSDHFLDLLTEIDSNGPETLEIHVTQNDNLKISARGISGLMEVLIPGTSDVVELFECNTEVIKARYRLAILKYAFKALQIAKSVSMKLNSQGILTLSIVLASKAECFLDFYCIPLTGDEDDYAPMS